MNKSDYLFVMAALNVLTGAFLGFDQAFFITTTIYVSAYFITRAIECKADALIAELNK